MLTTKKRNIIHSKSVYSKDLKPVYTVFVGLFTVEEARRVLIGTIRDSKDRRNRKG